jgi:8-oxo-dGTP pyrophosphatase MutT (NUDIX family)
MNTRFSARGLVFNNDGEILLLRAEDRTPVDPRAPEVLRYWVTPGGGTEPHESPEESLAREIYEEAGLRHVVIGACAWLREVTLELPQRGLVLCVERYFICTTAEVAISTEHLTESERHTVKELRWWKYEDLARSGETFRPPRFVALLSDLLSGSRPSSPIRIA